MKNLIVFCIVTLLVFLQTAVAAGTTTRPAETTTNNLTTSTQSTRTSKTNTTSTTRATTTKSTTSKTTSTKKPTTTASCKSGYKGKRNGQGPNGACCSHSDDCLDTCVSGICGVHP